MKKYILLFVLLASFAVPVYAAPAISFNTGGGPANANLLNNNTQSSATFAGAVTAEAFTYSGGEYTASYLWQRDSSPNDLGLGVCSEALIDCQTLGGNVNELSNQANFELLRLTNLTANDWSDIWVSSLDSQEAGTLYWSNTANADLDLSSSYHFVATGTATRSIFAGAFAQNASVASSKYLFFTAGPTGTDNDYLVYGVTAAIPEPEIYAMMAAGLALMGWVGRRRKQFVS